MSYFLKVADPVGVQKRLLESSKDVLHMLRGYHRLLETRDEKREVAEELRSVMRELARHAEELERMLPEKSLKEIEEYLPKRRPAAPRKGGKRTGKRKGKKKEPRALPAGGEAERLEHALKNIEDRLSRL
jgi:hypothetical protein